MKRYCTECGQPSEYISSPPKFCQGCGVSFDPLARANSKLAKASKPPRVVEDEDDDDEDEETETVSVPDMSGLEVEIEASNYHGISLKDVMATGPALSDSFVREKPPEQTRAEFLKQFHKEGGSLRDKGSNE